MIYPTQPAGLFSHPRFWAECFGPAPFLPMSRAEMDRLGWDSCDIIIVCGDAYVDHPSFGMAVIGRFLESQGFRVGLICQPDWTSADAFRALGKPNLFFGVSAGNMDSMINRYTADKKVRNDDAYTPGGVGGKRPDRAVLVYSQRCKEAYSDVPVVLGGIEASLRRIAQYDYWSDQVRRSVLVDATADILLYGNAERAIADIAHGLSTGKTIEQLSYLRGTAVVRKAPPGGWTEIDSSRIDWPGHIDQLPNPYDYQSGDESNDTQTGQKAGELSGTVMNTAPACQQNAVSTRDEVQPVRIIPMPLAGRSVKDENTYIRLPSFEKVRNDPVLYAHASRVLHQESNPYNARALIQKHGNREIWINPPAMPLATEEIDGVFDLSYARVPHPSYGKAKIPAYDMIKTSVNIMRGCFGGCTFCSITEHEGRIIQSRSEASILREIEDMRDKVPGFTGHVSDLGGPTANMYRLECKSEKILASCRRLSCVYPTVCKNLITSHKHTTALYRKARAIPGVNRISIASGLRYDLAVLDPEYVKELVTHHVGGMLKIAPEHTEERPLSMMMKPKMSSYQAFKKMFDKYSKEAGKTQYLVPYFIAAHPGTEDEDMLNLALWLKQNNFEVDQVQTFYPSPMSLATAMYYSGRNPLKKLRYKGDKITVPKDKDQRRLHKALLRYHDPENWGFLRESLVRMNKANLIDKLIPAEQTKGRKPFVQGGARQKASANKFDKIPARSPRGSKPAAGKRKGPKR